MTPADIYDFHQWFTKSFEKLLSARYATFYQALMLAVARNVRNIVETGTVRQNGNWAGDGQSTLVLGAFAKRYGCRVWTCDIDQAKIAKAREVAAQFAPHIEFVASDSVTFLRDFDQPIDLLYLDSMDFNPQNPDPPQTHALREAQAALLRLHNQSIILIDDCDVTHGGKGGKVIPFLLGQGWQVIGMKYQVLLTHAFSDGFQSPRLTTVKGAARDRSVSSQKMITFVIACKGRLSLLKQTLPTLVRLPKAQCVMVDFDCPDKSGDWVEQTYPQVQVVRLAGRPLHNQAEANNLGAVHVHTPWVCFTDAEIMFDPTFCDKVLPLLRPGTFWRARPKSEGIAGTTICAKADFDRAGGFDEIIKGSGYEDTDFVSMLRYLHVDEEALPADLISHSCHEQGGNCQDNKSIAQSWRANRLYSLLKFTLLDNTKKSLDTPFRERLYAWAVQTTAQLAEGNPISDMKVTLNRWDLNDTFEFLVNTAMVYSLEKKT